MTINRQLIAVLSALFLVVLIGVEWLSLRSAQRHFQGQLESVAQDAATSIGLALGTLLREPDAALAETVINPAFDRGQYARIEFVSPSGEVIAARAMGGVRSGQYPRWFAEYVPLHGPTAESLVTAGWRQLGRVRVTVHPRFAYEQLWSSTRQTVLYLLAVYAAAMLVLRLILAGVLRPLARIERAAQAISAHDFVTIETRPSTRELARVVDAINALSRRVRADFEAEVRRADAHQREAMQDAVTGMLNRRGLVEHYEAAHGAGSAAFDGTLVLVEVVALDAINLQLGAGACDALLKAMAGAIERLTAGGDGRSGRWAGAQFALVLPEGGATRAPLEALRGELRMQMQEAGVPSQAGVRMIAGRGVGRRSLEDLMGALGAALDGDRPEEDAPVRVVALDADPAQAARGALVAVVRDALEGGTVQLAGQSVLALGESRLLHTELMARIPGRDGRLIPAADFLLTVARNGWDRRFDERVIAQVCAAVRAGAAPGLVAVNLSPRALASPGFAEWLVAQVDAVRDTGFRFAFELSEHGVVRDEAAAHALSRALTGVGAAFAIDHFGLHRNSLALVARLRPAYLKLAAVHTGRIAGDSGTRFFIESIVRAAGQFDVPVIAQNVESAALLETLRALGVAGYQGHAAGAPAPWTGAAA